MPGAHRLSKRAVEIYGKVHVIPDGGPQCADTVGGLAHHGLPGLLSPAGRVERGLEGVIPLGEQLNRLRGLLLGRVAVDLVVDAHPVPGRAAEEFVYRDARPFAGDVPQGVIDAR